MSIRTWSLTFAVLGLAACKPSESRLPHQLPPPASQARVLPTKVEPPLAALPDAPTTDSKKVALGERLYHDPALSGDGTLSCASCHALDKGGTDSPRKVSVGIRGQEGPINSPTVYNAVFNVAQFWDGRAADLQAQAAGPVANPKEMGADWNEVITRLAADPVYAQAFTTAGYDGVTQANATHAIAEYERTLVTPARFDRFAKGDAKALSDDEREGMALFMSVGCTGCHAGGAIGGNSFQKMGVFKDYFALRGTPLTEADMGRFNVTKRDADKHMFKVPTLRNVALTSPYFHDAAAATLEEAITTMARVQLGKELSSVEVKRISDFLHALTGESFPKAPTPPPTGASLVP